MPAALVIIGAGGFGAEAAWVAEDMNHAAALAGREQPWAILGYADSDPDKRDQVLYGYRVLGSPEQVASEVKDTPVWFHCAIGKNALREKLVRRVLPWGWKAATLVHPSVIIARNVEIGEGSYIGAGTIVCPKDRPACPG